MGNHFTDVYLIEAFIKGKIFQFCSVCKNLFMFQVFHFQSLILKSKKKAFAF